MSPAVSVVMPTYNRLDRLPRVLGALAAQTVDSRSYEVVVVSDGSRDGTDEYLRSGRTPLPIVPVAQANGGPGAARNHGVERAQGKLIVFVDDDVAAAPDLIEQHLASQEARGRDGQLVVIGPMLTPADFMPSAWIAWEQDKLQQQYDAMERGDWAPTYRQFYTGNASLSREAFVASGGFDIRFRRAEDVELSYRMHEAGGRFEFNSRAIGWHYAERSFSSWISNGRDYGTNDVVFARDHGRDELLDVVRDEFPSRNPLIRGVVRSCVAWPALWRPMQAGLDAGARASARVGGGPITRGLLSATYNVAYYRGVADELGGSRPFEARILTPAASRP